MTSKLQHGKGPRFVLECIVSSCLLPVFCFSQPVISLSASSGPPTTTVQVTGAAFAPLAVIDLYFDTQDEALATADSSGSFSQIVIKVPASALPGTHWVSAVPRSSQPGAQAPFKVQADWIDFHRRNMMRFNPYENVLGVDSVKNLQLKWRHKIGGGQIYSSPVVAKDIAYNIVYIGGGDGNLYALNAERGTQLWTRQISVRYSPAVVNGVVYVGGGDGNVYALTARTGITLWSFATGASVTSSPTVVNKVVYVGSQDGNLYALNADTGAKLWSYATGGPLWYSSPAVVNGIVYLASYQDWTVYALNAKTGAKLWSFVTGYWLWSSPAVTNGVVYVGSEDSSVYALNASTGAVLWSSGTGDRVWSSPAVADGVVYIGSGDDNVYALNASTGAQLWSFNTGGFVMSSPALANGVVYIGGWLSNVFALDAATGAVLWSYLTQGGVESSPAVVDGMVYIACDDGHLYAFGLNNQVKAADVARPDLMMLRPDFNLK